MRRRGTGYAVYIEGADLVEHENLTLTATPYPSGTRALHKPRS